MRIDGDNVAGSNVADLPASWARAREPAVATAGQRDAVRVDAKCHIARGTASSVTGRLCFIHCTQMSLARRHTCGRRWQPRRQPWRATILYPHHIVTHALTTPHRSQLIVFSLGERASGSCMHAMLLHTALAVACLRADILFHTLLYEQEKLAHELAGCHNPECRKWQSAMRSA